MMKIKNILSGLAIICIHIQAQWIQVNDIYGTVALTLSSRGNNCYLSTPRTLYSLSSDKTMWKTTKAPHKTFDHILIGFSNDIFIYSMLSGLYYSKSMNDSFVTRMEGLPAEMITSLCEEGENSLICAVLMEGLYATSDNGETWTKHHDQLPGNVTFVYSLKSIADTLYCTTEEDFFKNCKDGKGWSKVTSGLSGGLIQPPEYFKKSLITATSEGVYSLDNVNLKWNSIGLIDYIISSILIFNDELFVCGYKKDSNAGSVYNFDCNDSTWKEVSEGLPQIFDPTALVNVNESMVLSTKTHGVFLKTNSLNKWENINNGYHDCFVNSISGSNGLVVLANAIDGSIYTYTSNTDKWQLIESVHENEGNVNYFSFNNRIFMTSTNGGLYNTLYDPVKWESVNDDIFKNKIFGSINGNNKSIILNDLSTNEIYTSSDSGISWRATGSFELAPYPHTTDIYQKNIAIIEENAFKLSTDSGKTFIEITEGLTVPCNMFQVSFVDSNVFLCTEYGIYYCEINNKKFVNISNGLPTLVNVTTFYEHNGIMVVCVDNESLYFKNSNHSDWIEIPQKIDGNALHITDVYINDYYLFVSTQGVGVWILDIKNLPTPINGFNCENNELSNLFFKYKAISKILNLKSLKKHYLNITLNIFTLNGKNIFVNDYIFNNEINISLKSILKSDGMYILSIEEDGLYKKQFRINVF